MRLLAIAGLIVAEIRSLPGAQPPDPDVATIVESGSTNRAGFRIVVDRSGLAEFTPIPRKYGESPEETKPYRLMLPSAAFRRLQADLAAARPFTSLPQVHCMKSASFGSTLIVESSGEHTPDLSCGDNGHAPLGNLIRDVGEIVALFHN